MYVGLLLEIIADSKFLLAISFSKGRVHEEKENAIIQQTKIQLDEYFHGKRKFFDLPISIHEGSPFQQSVWQALACIPYGTTISYHEIAKQINRETAVRAVANAIGKNPLAIVLPCHRVIGKDLKLHGFSGGIENKIYLLSLEKNY